MSPRILSLLTDYGLGGGFVGVCHGVALSVAPDCRIIDIDHTIPAQDVRFGALMLAQKIGYIPTGVHVAVVDPGVGTSRRPIAVAAGDRVFVGPDNGLLTWAVDRCGGPDRVVHLTNEDLWQPTRSTTFDGRDIFVPTAAAVLAGLPLSEAGDEVPASSLVRLDEPYARRVDDGVEAEIVQIDGSGNIQIHADHDLLRSAVPDSDAFRIVIGERECTAPFASSYGAVGSGDPVVLVDSDRQISIGVNCGRADRLMSASVGDTALLLRAAAGNDTTGS